MKLLLSVVLVLTGLLAGTACQSTPPKTENASVELEAVPSGAATAGAGTDTTTTQALDPNVQYLKGQLNLTAEQTKKLTEIFQDTSAQQKILHNQRSALLPAERKAQRKAWLKQVRELQNKKLERINAVLTEEQTKKYEKLRTEPPAMGAQPLSAPQPTE